MRRTTSHICTNIMWFNWVIGALDTDRESSKMFTITYRALPIFPVLLLLVGFSSGRAEAIIWEIGLTENHLDGTGSLEVANDITGSGETQTFSFTGRALGDFGSANDTSSAGINLLEVEVTDQRCFAKFFPFVNLTKKSSPDLYLDILLSWRDL